MTNKPSIESSLSPAEKQKLKAQMDRAYEDAKLGKEQKALDAGVLREALETACECPRCGREHRPLGFGRPPLNDADKQIAFLESAVKEALKSHAEIGEPPIATDRWIRLVTERDQIKEALVQLSRAVIALAELDNDKRTYFETNTAEAVIRWRRLNAAQAVARNLIGGQAMAPEGLPRKLPGQADD